MPSSGQSLTRPAGSLSLTYCQRNSPSDSRKHMRTPLSIGSSLASTSRLFRGTLLLVPTKILPPEITGPPYAFEPSAADHLMFFSAPFLPLQVVGILVSVRLTRLRDTVPPNIGQS